jgi:hypothetical protein
MIRGQKPFGTFGIRNIGGMHQHAQQEPIRVNPALPFAPVDPFFIVAAFSACCGRCDGLGVQDADGRLRVAIQRLSRQFAQGIIDFDECSITIPFVERVPNGAHWRNIFQKHAPLTARAIFGEQRVDDRAAIDVGRTSAVGRRGDDEWRDSSPLLIGQIGRILRLDRIEVHVVAYQIAPYQNGMVTIMIPQIRFSDRPLILIVVGFVLIITGFVYNIVFAGIPYQDPPPELVARYNMHATIAQTITTTGIITMLAGIVGSIVLRLLRR